MNIKFFIISLTLFIAVFSGVWAGDPMIDDSEYLVEPAAPFPDYMIGIGGKSLIVDLEDFRIYAYENGELVHSTLVATGRPETATLPGSFTITRKYEERDMTWRGNTVEDVPYVMYYDGSLAIHGAYWHRDFGERVSSGCVNLPLEEARWYYEFAEIGTPVFIQY